MSPADLLLMWANDDSIDMQHRVAAAKALLQYPEASPIDDSLLGVPVEEMLLELKRRNGSH